MSQWRYKISMDATFLHDGTVEADDAADARAMAREDWEDYVFSGYEPGHHKAAAVVSTPVAITVERVV